MHAHPLLRIEQLPCSVISTPIQWLPNDGIRIRYLAFALVPHLFVIPGKSRNHPLSCRMLFRNEDLRNPAKQTHYGLIILPEILCKLWVSLEKATPHDGRETGNQHSRPEPLGNTCDIPPLSNLIHLTLHHLHK